MKLKRKFPQVKFKGDFIDGAFVPAANPDFVFAGKSPADKDDTIGEVPCSYSSAEQAVAAAARARDSWALSSWEERKKAMDSLLIELRDRSAEFVELISREIGKPRWESAMEVASMEARVVHALHEFEERAAEFSVDDTLENWSRKGKGSVGVCRMKPRGVALALPHFNLPGDSPLSYLVPSLLSGNTTIYKPSKKAPGVGQLLAECMERAGFPKGVFNMVQGGREMARRLAQQTDVDTVFYAGDFEFGKQLRKDTFEHSEKLLVLETGGKNPAIVMDDADIDAAIRETLISAYLTCGQRAESTSRLILQQGIAEKFLSRFHEAAKKISIGVPFQEENPPFMGPLVDKKTVDRYLTFQGIAIREQGECIMRGKALQLESDGFYVTPSIYLFKNADPQKILQSVYLQTEVFGPSIGAHIVKDWEEAAAVANASNYALAASVFTADEEKFRLLWRVLRYGAIHWNEGTVRRSLRMPYGGIKRSFKAGPFARGIESYVNYAVSSIESSKARTGGELPPGLNLDKKS